MGDITALLHRMRNGDREAADVLLRSVYDQLKAIAASHGPAVRGRFGATPTLGPTALVHEVWVKLAGGGYGDYEDRRHFFAVAASAMRSVLVDHARARAALKRGGHAAVASSTSSGASVVDDASVVCGIHDALERLERLDPELVRVVELRFFLGLSVEETAATLDTSASTVKRQSRLARMFLWRELDPIDSEPNRDDTETSP